MPMHAEVHPGKYISIKVIIIKIYPETEGSLAGGSDILVRLSIIFNRKFVLLKINLICICKK